MINEELLSKTVSETRINGFINFELAPDIHISATKLRTMQGDNSKLFIPVRSLEHNGQTRLVYQVENKQTLRELERADPDSLRKAVLNIRKKLNVFLDYGFLPAQGLILDKEHIFLSMDTGDPSFIYLPHQSSQTISNTPFIQEAVEEIQNSLGLDCRQYAVSGTVLKIRAESTSVSDGIDKLQFLVDKEGTFTIGRHSTSDGVISGLSQISRKHFSIIKKSQEYWVVDEDSKGGTWLNNQRCIPKKKYKVQSSDRIEAAGIVFSVQITEEISS